MNRLRAALRWAGPDHLEHGIGQLIGTGSLSNCSLPLLGMGRDVPDGVMRLRDGELDVSWTTETSRSYLDGCAGPCGTSPPPSAGVPGQPAVVPQAPGRCPSARWRADRPPPRRGSLRPLR
ncbi:hypothetical protein [Kutzneria kofuensis]|uniref:hypothetical protein n=1 Tax=Kutzneria kofuensis TaxID=103725 RepID=UPI0031E6B0D3